MYRMILHAFFISFHFKTVDDDDLTLFYWLCFEATCKLVHMYDKGGLHYFVVRKNI